MRVVLYECERLSACVSGAPLIGETYAGVLHSYLGRTMQVCWAALLFGDKYEGMLGDPQFVGNYAGVLGDPQFVGDYAGVLGALLV